MVHECSGRAGPFVDVSAAHLSDELAPSRVCGFAKAAFTGATVNRMGLFEEAHGGTLFIDEAHLLTLAVQGVLLTPIASGMVTRLGEVRPRRVDVRVVFATNEDLVRLVQLAQFRHDLFARIGYQRVRIPPLCERRDDILPLAEYFLAAECALNGREEVSRIGSLLADALVAAEWRQNLWDLDSVCGWLATRRRTDLLPCDLPPEFVAEQVQSIAGPRALKTSRPIAAAARTAAAGCKIRAAERLGVSRQHLDRVLKAGGSA